MSRAFVRESDQDVASTLLPERPVSPHPNLVTADGLRLIETRVRELEAQRQQAHVADDPMEMARIVRDLRYWNQRRATARLVEPPANPDTVRFGVRVTLRLEDGTERAFRIVGEDEADPAKGLLSWVSPFARTLTGRELGDVVQFQGHDAEIIRLES